MKLRKYRWSRTYESSEEELFALLATKHITAERWTANGDEHIPAQTAQTNTQLWCAEGSVVFLVTDKRFSLQPGDGLDIPASTSYGAIAGFSGCVCYESSHPANEQ